MPIPTAPDPDSDPADEPASAVVDANTVEAETDETFQQLDRTWIGMARTESAIAFAIIGVVLLGSGSGLLWVLPGSWKMVVPLVWAGVFGLALLSIVWWPRWEFARWNYRLGSTVFELRRGVVWQSSICIPLSRLQHVDLHRGPLERQWGLASLQIHTAGTRDASQTLPGLSVSRAGQLRDELIEAANRK